MNTMKKVIKYCLAALLLILSYSSAHATLFIVNDTADVAPSFAGGVILRDAIGAAAPSDTIIIDVSGTILLTAGPIVINNPVVIAGPEPIHMTIDGNGNQAFFIDNAATGGTVVISGVTIENCDIEAAIEVTSGSDAYLNYVVLTANNDRGLLNQGNVVMENTTFYDNDGSSDGNAFLNFGGTAFLTNCTFGHNDGNSHGGAIYNHTGQIDLEWCTIVYNTAASNGGGIQNFSGSITMRNTIVADNTGSGDPNLGAGGGSYTSNGYNMISSVTALITSTTGDLFTPSLTTYLATTPQKNGFGMIFYPITSTNSPAVDGGTNAAGSSTPLDVRRAPRILDGRGLGSLIADIGAVEYSPLCVTSFSGAGSIDNIVFQTQSPTYIPPYYICFDIPGSGPHTLTPSFDYQFSEQVIIDGYSQPGSRVAGPGQIGKEVTAAYNPIEFDGGGLSIGINLFDASTEFSTIRGLTIYDYNNAILVDDEQIEIYGNHIGFDNSLNLRPCITGIQLGDGTASVTANGVVIGGSDYFKINVISGQSTANVYFTNDAGTGNIIAHNFIGTSPDGENVIDASYTGNGFLIEGGSANKIGDASQGGGNLITGNKNGIVYQATGTFNDTIAGNIIGLDISGTNALTNSDNGIIIPTGANFIVIGGVDDSSRNVISGNGASGIDVSSANIEIYHNFLGVAKDGISAAGNGDYGVYLHNGAQGNFIGRPSIGNVISSNLKSGVRISDAGTSGNDVQGNYIGMAVDGTTVRGNVEDGIQILFGASNNLIGGNSGNNEGNIISGNTGDGIRVGGNQTTIHGNFIGLDQTGGTAAPNNNGIYVSNAGVVNIGGLAANQGNFISGNTNTGVFMLGTVANVAIYGNVVGLDVTGNSALGNGGVGIYANDVSDLIIGNGSVAGRNFISGNGSDGIQLTGTGVTSTFIAGDIIGLAVDGDTDLGNNGHGIYADNSSNVTIGSPSGAAKTVISGNGLNGMQIGTGNNGFTVHNTIVGENEALTAVRMNSQTGIEIRSGSSNIAIGGINASEGNRIVGNGQDGIEVDGSTTVGNPFNQNIIYGNGGNDVNHLEIDLVGSNGVDVNDGGDGDTGANDLINFPELQDATSNCDGTGVSIVKGSLNSTANADFRIEFFSISAALLDPAGHGGGETYLGHTDVTTDGTGNVAFTFSHPGVLTVGDYITATSTRTSAGATVQTSEFSDGAEIHATPSSVSLVVSDETCAGLFDGQVYVSSFAGGAGPFNYLWTDGQDTDTAFSLSMGSYNVTVTDTNGCAATGTAVTVNPAAAIVFTVNTTDVSCNGDTDGTITFSGVSGGTGPYQYSIDGGTVYQTSSSFTNVAPGSYTCSVLDNNGCVEAQIHTVGEPAALSVTTTSTDVSCWGASDGTAVVSVTGGMPGYSYAWNPGGATTSSVTGLTAGTYTVTVLDANGCTANGTETVNQPSQISFTTTYTDPACTGDLNGSITFTGVSGGVTPYQYSIDGGLSYQASATFTGLGAASYPVVVLDNTGCLVSNSVTLTDPAPLVVNADSTDIVCNGGNNGTVTANVTGGTPGYTYNWSPGGYTSASVNNLSQGTYTVTVIDANNCIASSTTTINEPTVVTFTTTVVDATCSSPNGSVTVSAASGGDGGPYMYSFDGGTFTTNPVFNGIAGGTTVAVTVMDGAGCTGTSNITVVNLPGPNLDSIVYVEPTCAGDLDGAIAVYLSPLGLLPPNPYTTDNGATYTSSNIFSNLGAGSITVGVIDTNGCTYDTTLILGEPNVISITPTVVDASCNGVCDGQVSIAVTGGTGAYTYDLDGDPNGPTWTNLCAGSPSITVTDANGCQLTIGETINEPALVDASFTYAADTFCIADANPLPTITGVTGGLFSSVSGGVNFVSTTTGQIDLGSTGVGNFTIVYTTSGACPNSDSVVVTIEGLQSIGMTAAGPFCESDGFQTLSATPANGTWSASCGACIDANTGVFDPGAAAGGTHTIYYSAGVGNCVGTDSISIVVNPSPTYQITGGGSYCAGDNPPNIDVVFTSNAYPLTVDINQNGSLFLDDDIVTVSTVQYSGLPAGDYEIVFVSDNNGCINTATSTTISIVEIPLPDAPTCSADQTICDGDSIPDLTATGSGVGSIEWYDDNALTNNIASGATLSPGANVNGPGQYWFYAVENDNGCVSLADSVLLTILTAPSAPTANTTFFTYCEGEAIVALTAVASGGGTLTWYDDAALTNQVGTGLTYLPAQNLTGLNEFYVTESLGSCESAALTIQINVENAGTGDAGADQEICLGATAQLEATGGATYLWNITTDLSDINIADPVATPDSTATYTVLITSANNCTFTDSVTVTVVDGEDCGFVIYNAFSPDGDGTNDTWIIEGIEQYSINTVQIFNRWGDKLYDFENYNNADVVWDGNNENGDILPAGTYYYIIDIEDGTRTYSGWVYLSK